MRNSAIVSLSIICLLYLGCSKSKQSGPDNNTSPAVKIELVSGNNQTDTVGRQLANGVVVKVTQNGTALSNYTLAFQGSGCNSDHQNLQQTAADGTSSYNWLLAGDVGPQTLKIYAINSQNQKVDSITAASTGLAPGPGWHYSACTVPLQYGVSSFCKLGTGRLFATFGGAKAYLRYSDDNGISWNPVKGLGNSHSLQYAVSSATDELFAFAPGEGMFYSNDAGTTWTTASTQAFNNNVIISAVCTPSGKLLVAVKFAVYVSADKGKTWAVSASAAFVPPNSGGGGDGDFGGGAEDQNGNLYVVGQQSQNIYKSTDIGKTWVAVPRVDQYELDFYFYIDKNNWFYKSISNSDNTGGIAISKDNGTVYTQFIKSTGAFIENLSLQSDGNFYYCLLGQGLYMVNATNNSVKKLDNNDSENPTPYIVAKNNNIIYGFSGNGRIRYYQK